MESGVITFVAQQYNRDRKKKILKSNLSVSYNTAMTQRI